MTSKQSERVKVKIKKLKAVLARDKKQWGGYHHDGQGIRYLIARLYLQLEDYKGGQRYFNWFRKNFPDDMGYPDFLFEWTIVLFMVGKVKEAEKKLFETFCRNTYVIDKFLGKEIMSIDKWEGSNLETPEFTEYFHYSADDQKHSEFSKWLINFIETEKFSSVTEKFLATEKRLKSEKDTQTRHYLIEQQKQLLYDF